MRETRRYRRGGLSEMRIEVNHRRNHGKRRNRPDADRRQARTLRRPLPRQACGSDRLQWTDFNEACKAIGQKARVEASVLSKFITARIAETSDKAAKDASQLSMLFDEVGL